MTQTSEPLLKVEHLKVAYPIRSAILQRRTGENVAVSKVNFELSPGQTVGLVGESGSGKSSVARTVIGLVRPSDGRVIFQGQDITNYSPRQLKDVRRQMQMIFQDPYASLNPRYTIEQIIAEGWRVHPGAVSRKQWQAEVKDLLDRVGLNPDYSNRYPHQFSGGQRQRLGIARALAVSPDLIVCDEPVSALDVSIQAQVVNLLKDLQARLGLSYLFIAHDLAVVKHIADRVAVMYLGRLVEIADKRTLFAAPRHPYTQALLSAIPKPDPALARSRILLPGDVPSPLAPPSGCRFHTRCTYAQAKCSQETPALRPAGAGHQVACHFFEQVEVPRELTSLAGSGITGKFAERLALFEAAKHREPHPA